MIEEITISHRGKENLKNRNIHTEEDRIHPDREVTILMIRGGATVLGQDLTPLTTEEMSTLESIELKDLPILTILTPPKEI